MFLSPMIPTRVLVLSDIFDMPNLLSQKLHFPNQLVTAAFGSLNASAIIPRLQKAQLGEKTSSNAIITCKTFI